MRATALLPAAALLAGAALHAAPPRAAGVELYTARRGTYARGTAFRLGDTVIVRLANGTERSLFYRSDPAARELARGEDLRVDRRSGAAWSNAVTRTYIDESPVRCTELRPGMNATRSWTA